MRAPFLYLSGKESLHHQLNADIRDPVKAFFLYPVPSAFASPRPPRSWSLFFSCSLILFTAPQLPPNASPRRRLAENTAAVQKLGGEREGNPTLQSVWTPPSPLDTQLQLGRGSLSEGDLS